ncbi:MAG: dimethylsulfonioproprionate lyase family protein [Steroidobacteraceae bacterium]|jgi:hypothetical protein
MAVTDGIAASVRRSLERLAEPALAPFLAEWPQNVAARAVVPHSLSVLRWLPEVAAAAPRFDAELVGELCDVAPLLAWRQTYSVGEVGPQFLDNYGWSELIGHRGPLPSERVACGFLLLGPATSYPRHHHQAEELYLPLAGLAAWQQGDDAWCERPPGTLIHHRSDEPHAMKTSAQPLLALYLWRGEGLSGNARLDQ